MTSSASTMSFTVKAYLKDGERLREIRRFSIDQGASTSYEYLVQKIARMFSSLQGKVFQTYWRDPDGDYVAFSSDDELMEALSYKVDAFKVYLEVDAASPPSAAGSTSGAPNCGGSSCGPSEPPASVDGLVHPHVTCDVCRGPVKGMRFKCTVCPDYDLCSACERRGEHLEHNMLRIAKPRSSWCQLPRPAHPRPAPPQPCFVGMPVARGVPKEWGLRCTGGCSGSTCGCYNSAAAAGSGCCGAADTAAEAAASELERRAKALLEPLLADVHVMVDGDRPCGGGTAEPMTTESCGGGDDGKRLQEPPSVARMPGSTYPFWPTDVPGAPAQHVPTPMEQQQQGLDERKREEEEEEEELEVKVADAVESMRAMGFHNEDGWLTALLRSNGCDVQKAVDEVLRKSRQQ